MEDISNFILVIYGVGVLLVVGIIIYLIVKRIDDKKNEDFEQRDN